MESKAIDQLQIEVNALDRKQEQYRKFAWAITIFGILLFASGWIIRISYPNWQMESLGSYLSGTSGGMWGFSGLLFIYMGFLGQKQEIKNQQIELKLTRKEMESNRIEFEGQKKAMLEQSKSLAAQLQLSSREIDYRMCREAILELKNHLSEGEDELPKPQQIKNLLRQIRNEVINNGHKIDRENKAIKTFLYTNQKLVTEFKFRFAAVVFLHSKVLSNSGEYLTLLNEILNVIRDCFELSSKSSLDTMREQLQELNLVYEVTEDIPFRNFHQILRMHHIIIERWDNNAGKFYEEIFN